MPKTLIVTAHPSPKGFTHGIANAIAEKRKEDGNEVEILDLYKTNLVQDYLRFENVREIPVNPHRDIIQQKITEANELIFIHPIWWLSMPAIMKNFVDNNFSSKFAYKYVKGKRVPLLKGKTARVYVTCDAPFWLYLTLALPYLTVWVAGILMFCGIKVTGFTIIRNRAFRDDEARMKFLESLKKHSKHQSIFLRILNKFADIIQ
ncbi:MAG: NAD(P)H-dependent oxidoreductase [Candidatus Paceibacterota bacterium]